jgi:subtilisin family serine protease
VAAAGNENTGRPSYPAAYEHVISVAATDESDKRARFSNYGTTVDVFAPGVQILSTFPGGGYGMKEGTSMASRTWPPWQVYSMPRASRRPRSADAYNGPPLISGPKEKISITVGSHKREGGGEALIGRTRTGSRRRPAHATHMTTRPMGECMRLLSVFFTAAIAMCGLAAVLGGPAVAQEQSTRQTLETREITGSENTTPPAPKQNTADARASAGCPGAEVVGTAGPTDKDLVIGPFSTTGKRSV